MDSIPCSDHGPSLPSLLHDLALDLSHCFRPPPSPDLLPFSLRVRSALRLHAPKLKHALRHTSSDIVAWMQKGGPWRAFLVTAVGIVLLLALAGFGAFMLFFVTATVNAVAIGFLASVASVGAFIAFFFTALMAIYIGALITAGIAISTITFFTICAALTAAGWIAFFWLLWQVAIKGFDLFRGSVLVTVSALTAVSSRPFEKIHY